jgi:glycosyltransferase involved in cell wall biosynthesis
MNLGQSRRARRILALTPFPPSEHASHGGGRVMAQLLTALAERNRVTILTLRAATDPAADARLRERCELIEEIPLPPALPTLRCWVARRARLARDLVRGIPPWPSDWDVSAFRTRVAALAADWRPDVLQLEYHVMARYLPALVGCAAPRVLTEYEPGIVAARQYASRRRGFARGLAELELLAWKRFERRAIRSVDAVVVLTERDCAELRSWGQPTRIVRIPLGVLLPPRPLNAAGAEPPRLLFVGSFVHPPNLEAAMRLATTILPLLLAHHPDVVLDVVGADPPLTLRRTANAHVAVSGTVPDVTPYLDRAAVVVAPLRLGGGMRVKVLEALAAGKALVASPLAVEGLDVVDGKEVLLAETDVEFVDQIGRLLDDRAARTALATRAREWARTRHGWERSVGAYEALYDELMEARHHSRERPAVRRS